MSVTLAIDLNAIDLYLGTPGAKNSVCRKLTIEDLKKVLSNLGYEVDWDHFPIDKPAVFNYQDVEDVLWESLCGTPTETKITVKQIKSTNIVMLTLG